MDAPTSEAGLGVRPLALTAAVGYSKGQPQAPRRRNDLPVVRVGGISLQPDASRPLARTANAVRSANISLNLATDNFKPVAATTQSTTNA